MVPPIRMTGGMTEFCPRMCSPCQHMFHKNVVQKAWEPFKRVRNSRTFLTEGYLFRLCYFMLLFTFYKYLMFTFITRITNIFMHCIDMKAFADFPQCSQSNFYHCQLASLYSIKFFMCCVILTLQYWNEKCFTICVKFGYPSLKKRHKLRPSLIRLPT